MLGLNDCSFLRILLYIQDLKGEGKDDWDVTLCLSVLADGHLVSGLN
jgi:hypothetical protein